jgi:hypothetical protein
VAIDGRLWRRRRAWRARLLELLDLRAELREGVCLLLELLDERGVRGRELCDFLLFFSCTALASSAEAICLS